MTNSSGTHASVNLTSEVVAALPASAEPGVARSRWLHSARFDAWLQLGALLSVAPALALYATLGSGHASTYLSLGALVAIPFLHVFGSFFVAFSRDRNTSATTPRQLVVVWAVWTLVVLAVHRAAPRELATFALLYGGWHILRQNFGFLRELAGRAGLGEDRSLRRWDLATCFAPALALWAYLSARGPWRFISDEIHHVPVPPWLLAGIFAAVPVCAVGRELWIARLARRALPSRARTSLAGTLLVAGNAVALLLPALLLDDLLLIYTLAATYHGFQYLAYVANREQQRAGRGLPSFMLGESASLALAPLCGAIALMMMAWFAALLLAGLLLGPALAERVLLVLWFAIVPFHYFVDGRIWRRNPVRTAT